MFGSWSLTCSGLRALLAATIVTAQVTSGSSSDNLVVDLGYAKFNGIANDTVSVNSWFGIRYAQAPTQNLRWRAPVPAESANVYDASQVVDASNTGPICPQGYPAWRYNSTPGSSTPVVGSEDCLLLDILTPQQPASTRLPVMVQIHGGGYTQNYAEANPGYGVVNISNGNLIYVTIQYRLGMYGFLSSNDIRGDGTANAGLLDQRLALDWVQRHIGSFGGDPDRVTIIGGSAGGGSVLHQMLLNGGVGRTPFRAAIPEFPWLQTFHNDSILEKQYRQVLNASACSDLECLRSLSESTLINVQQQVFLSAYQGYGYGDFYFGPSVDGQVVRDLPSIELAKGSFAKVPTLTLRDGYEGFTYTNRTLNSTSGPAGNALIQTDISRLYPASATQPSFFKRLFQVYPAENYNSTFWQRVAIFGDSVVVCPSTYIASAVSDYVPAWKMIFEAGSQLHGADAPFLWTYGYGNTTGQNLTLANIMKDYYVSFTIHLDPNAESFSGSPKPQWPQYATGGPTAGFTVLRVNQTEIAAEDDIDASGGKCDFWARERYVVRN